MTPTPAERTENAGGPPRLGWFVGVSLVLAVAIELAGQYAESQGAIRGVPRATCSLLAACILALSLWYVLNRVYRVAKVKAFITLAAGVLILSQVVNLMDDLAFLGPMSRMLRDVPPYSYIENALFLKPIQDLPDVSSPGTTVLTGGLLMTGFLVLLKKTLARSM